MKKALFPAVAVIAALALLACKPHGDPTTYAVRYDANGATSGQAPSDAAAYDLGDQVTVLGPGALARTDSVFSGWNTEAEGTGASYGAGDTFAIESDTVLYAIWVPGYSVIYMANGASAGSPPLDPNLYAEGSQVMITGKGSLNWPGYIFAGWKTAATGTATIYNPGNYITMGASDLILYANWTDAPVCRVTYHANSSNATGDVPVDANSYVSGTTATVVGPGTLTCGVNYDFSGWNSSAAGTGTAYEEGAEIVIGVVDVDLYAQWTYVPTFNVVYRANGGTGLAPSDPVEHRAGSDITILGPGSLAMDDYDFAGWDTLAAGGGTHYAANAVIEMPATDLELFAQWMLKPFYYVTYSADGSTSGAAPTDGTAYHAGDLVTVLPNSLSLARTNSSFTAWDPEEGRTGRAYSGSQTFIMPAANVTLYPRWNDRYRLEANGPSGLKIWDFNDPDDPVFAGIAATTDDAISVFESAGRIYVIEYDSNTTDTSLDIYDAADPINPVRLRNYVLSDSLFQNVAVRGGYAYITDAMYGLRILDVSNPAAPSLAGTRSLSGYETAVALRGDYAYVATRGHGLSIVNIATPSNPTLSGALPPSPIHDAYGISLSGSYAYLACDDEGMIVVNIANPAAPAVAATYNPSGLAMGNVRGVVTRDGYAYLSASNGFYIVDISVPTAPVSRGSAAVTDATYATIEGDNAFVAAMDAGIQVVSIADKAAPSVVWSDELRGSRCNNIVKSGDSILVASTLDSFILVDASDPDYPVGTGRYRTDGLGYDVAAYGAFACLAAGASGIEILDLSDPKNITVEGSYDENYLYAYDVAISGSYAFVAAGSDGVVPLDLSDLSDIQPGTIYVGDILSADFIAVSGTYAYIIDGYNLVILDISNPAAPAFRGDCSISLGPVRAIAVSGNYVYLATYYGLMTIDVTDKTAPVQADYCSVVGQAYSVSLGGNYAYVAMTSTGIAIVDISDPGNLVYGNDHITTTSFYDAIVDGSRLYAATLVDGIMVYDVSDPLNPDLVSQGGESRQIR